MCCDSGSAYAFTIDIRQAVSSDLLHITQHYGSGDSPGDPFADPAKLQSIALEGLIVAQVQGQYAGFLYWFVEEKPWFDPQIGRYAHMVEVQVVERCRGQGVGKKLLGYALERLKGNAIEAIYIDTPEDNTAARHLYESAGFRPFSGTIHYKLEANGW